MNVYEEAHNLARAIKESEEFKEYKSLHEEIEKDEQVKTMINDFMKKNMEIQASQISGKEAGEDLVNQMQSLYQMLMTKPLAAKFLEAEMRVSVMFKDVLDIIGEPMNIESK